MSKSLKDNMKIYIAATFNVRDSHLMRDTIQRLIGAGHQITSRWITQMYPTDRTSEFKAQCASEDLEDIRNADALLLLCDGHSRGKHIEFGYAYALEKRIFVIGDEREDSVFFHLPGVIRYSNRFDVWKGLE